MKTLYLTLLISLLVGVTPHASAQTQTIDGTWKLYSTKERLASKAPRFLTIDVRVSGDELCGRFVDNVKLAKTFSQLNERQQGQTSCKRNDGSDDKLMLWGVPALPKNGAWVGGGADASGKKGGAPGRLLDLRTDIVPVTRDLRDIVLGDPRDPVIGDETKKFELKRDSKRPNIAHIYWDGIELVELAAISQ